MGFEPTTSCLGSKHSTAELHPHQIVSILVPKLVVVKEEQFLYLLCKGASFMKEAPNKKTHSDNNCL